LSFFPQASVQTFPFIPVTPFDSPNVSTPAQLLYESFQKPYSSISEGIISIVFGCCKLLESAILEMVFPTELILSVKGLRLCGETIHVSIKLPTTNIRTDHKNPPNPIIHKCVDLLYKFIYIVVDMREGILAITERILKLLSKGERSMHSISEELNIHWDSTVKSLEFLKRVGLVKERKGKKNYKYERLFSLK